MRVQNVVIGAIVVIASLAVFGAVVGPRNTMDPAAGTKLAGNIAYSCTDPTPAWCLDLTQKNGSPFVEMQDTIAFVHFGAAMDGAPIAMQTCQYIAAITNDGDTAKPLGITNVVVYANGKIAAQCRPPH